MMKRGVSGKKTLIVVFGVMLVVTLLCLMVCGVYALSVSQKELQFCNAAALDMYMSGLSRTMEDLEAFNEEMVSNDRDFILLSSQSTPTKSAERVLAEHNIRRIIQYRLDSITGILVCNAKDSFMYYGFGEYFLGNDGSVIMNRYSIEKMKILRSYLLSDSAPRDRIWSVFEVDDSVLLINTFRRKDSMICSMIDIGKYATIHAADSDYIDFCFLTKDQILTNRQQAERYHVLLEEMLGAAETAPKAHSKHILQTQMDPHTGIGLCGIISLKGIWGNARILSGILAISILIVVLLFVYLYYLLSRMLIYPLNEITNATKMLASGATEFEQKQERITEFSEIQGALQNLVREKVNLQQEKEDEASQKEHALLQYYQLQTRSHFFLNCLKSIYNLAAKGEKERTMRTISLFSNHLRYIYHDSLKFVTIQQELDEVRDYFSIIELERSDHVLLEEKVDESLLSFQVPPLIIQTFVENFNKHNAQSDHILRFAVKIDKVELEDREYVRIRMTDNGIGYSEDTLKKLQTQDEMFGQYHVGVQNLCRRMDILYHKQYQTMFANNRNGGAMTVFYLPVRFD